MDKNLQFQNLFKAYKEAFSEKSSKTCQPEVTDKWNEIKNSADWELKSGIFLRDLKSIALKKKGKLLSFWSQSLQKENFLKHNLDAFFISTNAPGRSAFNRVERRMAPLSKELAGLILPHDKMGSHLDGQGCTINVELEKDNFKFAGETLAEVWSQITFDNYPVVSEFISPENSELCLSDLETKNKEWFCQHVRTSQYFTQIVKCQDLNCCSRPRSSYFNVIPCQFLPALIKVSDMNTLVDSL